MAAPSRAPSPAPSPAPTPAPSPLPLVGAGAFLAFTVVAVLVGRGGAAVPETQPAAIESLAFRAEDQADGGVLLREAASARLVARIRPGEDGFLRGTLRGLAQARQREGLGREEPFRLARLADGRLTLDDAATGRRVALDAFGHTNAAAFARLLAPETRS